MADKMVMVQVAVKIEPTTWRIESHDGRVIGGIARCAPDSYRTSCYTGQVKKGKPVEAWSAAFPTLDQAVEEIVAEHYPKVAV